MNQNSNENVSYRRDDIVSILRDLEMMVVSLDRLGSAAASVDAERNAARVNEFVDQWQVLPRLAKIRQILSDTFSRELGADRMDELERLMQDVPHWTESQPDPPPSWQEDVWKDSEATEDDGRSEWLPHDRSQD